MKIFKDRVSAGKLLVKHLKQYKGKQDTIVLAIPRGGVVVAAEMAKNLNLPLDIIVTRKIGAPSQEELALGAIDPDGDVVWDEQLLEATGLNKDQLHQTIKDELAELTRRQSVYRQSKAPLNLKGQTVILVDDGIATGSTTLATVKYLKRHQAKKVVLAVPVASQDAARKIIREIGEFGEAVVLETPQYFQAVGQFYHHFEPVTDQEVIQLLK